MYTVQCGGVQPSADGVSPGVVGASVRRCGQWPLVCGGQHWSLYHCTGGWVTVIGQGINVFLFCFYLLVEFDVCNVYSPYNLNL